MALVTNADGSHVWVPGPMSIGSDIDELLQPRERLPVLTPLGGREFADVDLGAHLGNAFAGIHLFRWEMSEGRGRIKQRGYFHKDYDASSELDMVFDEYEIGRHPYAWGTTATPDPTAYGGKLEGSNFLGVSVFTVADQVTPIGLKDTGTYVPTIAAIPGFAAPAGATVPLCNEAIQINGAPWWAIGYLTANVNTLQVLSDLANPPTSSTVAVGAYPTWGLCQTPIDGDSLMIYNQDASGGLIKTVNTNVALGAATYYSRSRVPLGGFMPGIMTLGPNPEVFIVVPKNGIPSYSLFATPGYLTPPGITFNGKLLRLDLRAFTVSEVKTNGPFIKYFTNVGGKGGFYCDGRRHNYITRGADIPVEPYPDRLLENANVQRICGGHHTDGDKVWWEEHYVDQTGGVNVEMQRWEYDPYRNRVSPVSARIDLGGTVNGSTRDTLAMGGNRMPVTPVPGGNNLISYSNLTWRHQFQHNVQEQGYQLRHTDGASVISGRLFEESAYRTTAKLTLKDHPRALFLGGRIIGPPREHLRTGSGAEAGEDYANAYCTVAVTGCPTVTFRADYAQDMREEQVVAENASWTPYLQATVTGFRETTATNSTRRTTNPWPITVEGVYVEAGFKPPSAETLRELLALAESL